MSDGTRRVNRGRGHSYVMDGDKADGITGILRNGIPKPQFIKSAVDKTAGYTLDYWDELAELPPSERLKRMLRAQWDYLKSAGERGTDVHTIAHKLATGEEVDVPDTLTGHVDAYLEFTRDWEPLELLTETVVGNRQHRYMGTLDTVAKLADGKTWLLDWKTAASGIWPESALQLAAYRHAEFYLDAQANEQPMPDVDRTGCVWLRADGYDLIPVKSGPDVLRVFLYAQQVAHFVDEPREAFIGDAISAPARA